MTELLKITHIKDDICQVEATVLEEEKAEILAAALLGAMVRDEGLASAIIAAAGAYSESPEDLEAVADRSIINIINPEALKS